MCSNIGGSLPLILGKAIAKVVARSLLTDARFAHRARARAPPSVIRIGLYAAPHQKSLVRKCPGNSRSSPHSSNSIFQNDICELESYHPSHAVGLAAATAFLFVPRTVGLLQITVARRWPGERTSGRVDGVISACATSGEYASLQSQRAEAKRTQKRSETGMEE
jgi:hypothetical protein